jgi:hypothetical protein
VREFTYHLEELDRRGKAKIAREEEGRKEEQCQRGPLIFNNSSPALKNHWGKAFLARVDTNQ